MNINLDTSKTPIYNTNRYAVYVLEEPVIDEHYGVTVPLNYAIYNKSTKVAETFSTYEHMARQICDKLTSDLDELSPVARVAEITSIN